MRSNHLLTLLSVLGAVAVMLGAFAAHGLKAMLSPYHLEVFNTGVFYQFIHVLAALFCWLLMLRASVKTQKTLRWAINCFIIGIFCFSGSLYALAITGIKWFGPITPMGGLLFIVGWLMLAVSAWKFEEVTQ
ncbi:DUF423 domain-containing protein [Vibrio sp. SCSIO 43136]|uniref:DUF423 domain-containing protein n=1 Tax=Vibrio sp. SCSIO 43136 TaxID=2819101 RepID=UPI002075D94C|nr:DUF423 domain-containing protein [Vibrio sp. SCSIO 43136]USD65881.1 DUF423 domain-containing protein [Vibrio sp. SCSIO 43136]